MGSVYQSRTAEKGIDEDFTTEATTNCRNSGTQWWKAELSEPACVQSVHIYPVLYTAYHLYQRMHGAEIIVQDSVTGESALCGTFDANNPFLVEVDGSEYKLHVTSCNDRQCGDTVIVNHPDSICIHFLEIRVYRTGKSPL